MGNREMEKIVDRSGFFAAEQKKRPLQQQGGVSIYLLSQIRYMAMPFDIASLRYDLNPSRPAGHIECIAHIERFAYIENPERDLYRAYKLSSASFTAARVAPIRMKKANSTLG